MANQIFVKGLQAKYNALDPKNATTIYFTTDTRSLYVGGELYTEPVRFYTGSQPTTPAVGILYFSTDSGLGSVYTGTEWINILKPIAVTLSDTSTNDEVAGAKAVVDYVKDAIEEAIDDATHDSNVVAQVASKTGTNGTLEITKGNGDKVDAPLTGVAHDPVYDQANLKLTIPVVGSDPIVIDIPKDNFVDAGSHYDPETKDIVLIMKQGGTVRIPAAALIDIYTSGSGQNDTISINVGTDNKISATFKVDTTGALDIAEDGKLTIDLDAYATVTRVEAVEAAITTLNGDAQTAGSVAKAVADAVAGVTGVTNAIDTRLETVEESLTWGTID